MAGHKQLFAAHVMGAQRLAEGRGMQKSSGQNHETGMRPSVVGGQKVIQQGRGVIQKIPHRQFPIEQGERLSQQTFQRRSSFLQRIAAAVAA